MATTTSSHRRQSNRTRQTDANGHRTQATTPSPDLDEENYYQLLGVRSSSSAAEITSAYRRAMKRSHPDRVHPDRRAAAEELAKLLNRAYSTLANPITRQTYDRTARAQEMQDQLMRRYVGGLGGPGIGGADPFAQALRREMSPAERADQRRADRSAMLSLLLVFVVVTAVVITLIVLWAVVSLLLSLIF
ncbi:MAG: J domain-containing protein [Chloroflexia bacterium]|nr:J domain-containing protein [Chloroflexia bacterium]